MHLRFHGVKRGLRSIEFFGDFAMVLQLSRE